MVVSARYGVEGGRLKGVAARHLYGGLMSMPCVGKSGVAIMLVTLLETGSIRFFGRMFGLVGCHLESGSAGYMTCWCLRGNMCLICVS
jgi:hypothetical protein